MKDGSSLDILCRMIDSRLSDGISFITLSVLSTPLIRAFMGASITGMDFFCIGAIQILIFFIPCSLAKAISAIFPCSDIIVPSPNEVCSIHIPIENSDTSFTITGHS